MFYGLYTALITPFRHDGSFDESAYKKIIKEQKEAKVDGVVAVGTTGESPTVTHEENLKIIQCAIEASEGDIEVIAGTGSNSTAEAIEMTVQAKKMGANGALIVCPYYNKPSQEGIYRHYKAIADAVPDFPIILYNVPGRTSVSISPETVLRLSKISNIVCLKDATNKLDDITALSGKLPKDFTILSGDDAMTVDMIKRGAKGLIAVSSNLRPKELRKMVHDALEGNMEEAEKMSAHLQDLFRACFLEANPIPIKAMMAMEGKCEEVYRLPLCEPSEATRAILKKIEK